MSNSLRRREILCLFTLAFEQRTFECLPRIVVLNLLSVGVASSSGLEVAAVRVGIFASNKGAESIGVVGDKVEVLLGDRQVLEVKTAEY